MADTNDEIISREIKRIARGNPVVVYSGKVDKVNDDGTVDVILTGDDAAVEVMNNVVTGNIAGVYGKPKVGTDCEVAELDGGGAYTMIRAREYDSIQLTVGSGQLTVKDGLVQLNDGSFGGIPEIEKLKDNLKAIHDFIFNDLKGAIEAGFTGVGAGSGASGPNGKTAFDLKMAALSLTFEEMENKKATHGK